MSAESRYYYEPVKLDIGNGDGEIDMFEIDQEFDGKFSTLGYAFDEPTAIAMVWGLNNCQSDPLGQPS